MASPRPPAALRLPVTALRALRSTTITPNQTPFSRPFQYPSPIPISTLLPLRNNATRSSGRRAIHATPATPQRRQRKPIAHNREEVPDQPPTTDFGKMDVLASTPVPSTAVEVCREDGFGLNSGVQITGGDGALLVGGEAFCWRPWEVSGSFLKKGEGKGGKRLVNEKGQWEVGEEAFGVLGLVWPRPDLLILGLGPEIRPLSPATRKAISNLGMRVEVLDTRNAASQYNMLATERGVEDVAAALIPIGWKEGAE